MPVLPDVGSMMCVSLSTCPALSPASIIARPMRSFTLESGLKNSHFTWIVEPLSGPVRRSFTSGVSPIVSRMLS